MVSVSLDSKKNDWKRALKNENMPWEQLVMTDELFEYSKDWLEYEGIIPTVFFTDNDGKIIESQRGFQVSNRNIFEKIIEKVNR